MRYFIWSAILGILVVSQSGCAAGVSVTRPRLPTIVVTEVPPAPPAPPPAARRAPPPPRRHEPAPRLLTRGQAVSIGKAYCAERRLDCHLKKAQLKRNQGEWQIKFDAWEMRRYRGKRHGKQKVDLRIGAYDGRIYQAKRR